MHMWTCAPSGDMYNAQVSLLRLNCEGVHFGGNEGKLGLLGGIFDTWTGNEKNELGSFALLGALRTKGG